MQIGVFNPYQNYTSNARKIFKGNEVNYAGESAKDKAIKDLGNEAGSWWTKLLKEHEAKNEAKYWYCKRSSDEQYSIFKEVLSQNLMKSIKENPYGAIGVGLLVDITPQSDELIDAFEKANISIDSYALPDGSQMYIQNGEITAKKSFNDKSKVIYTLPDRSVLWK